MRNIHEEDDRRTINARLVDIMEKGKQEGEFTVKLKTDPRKLRRHFPGVDLDVREIGGRYIISASW